MLHQNFLGSAWDGHHSLHDIAPFNTGEGTLVRSATFGSVRARHASHKRPTKLLSMSLTRRATARARPAAAGIPSPANAAAAPLSSAPIRAGNQPPIILTARPTASIERMAPPRRG